MEILGVGPAELVLIALIAFVVLGPERLPALMHTLGKWIHQLRQASFELGGEMSAELNSTAQEVQAVQQDLQDLSRKFSYQVQKELGLTPQPGACSAMPPPEWNQVAPYLDINRELKQAARQWQGLLNRKGQHQ